MAKSHLALSRPLRALGPGLLSDELRRTLDVETLMSPPTGEAGREAIPVTRDPGLEQLVRLYRGLSEQKRETFLTLMQAAASALRAG